MAPRCPGSDMCGAGRVVCLIDPVGDVYACPFAIHPSFLAGNVRDPGGFAGVWQHSELFSDLRRPQTGGACESCSAFGSCRGGCMAAKFFTGLPLDGPDPECVRGHGEQALAAAAAAARAAAVTRPLAPDRPAPGGERAGRAAAPVTACDATLLARFAGPSRPAGDRPPTGVRLRRRTRWPGSCPGALQLASAPRTVRHDARDGGHDYGRVAVVTGAARGIGAATVLALAADGWSVLAVDSAADDPALPYPMASPADLSGVVRRANEGAGDPAGCGPSSPTCATRTPSRLPWPRRSTAGAAWTRRSRRRA